MATKEVKYTRKRNELEGIWPNLTAKDVDCQGHPQPLVLDEKFGLTGQNTCDGKVEDHARVEIALCYSQREGPKGDLDIKSGVDIEGF